MMYQTLFLSESGPVGNLTIVRVNSSTLRVEWIEPADFNGVFQTYRVKLVKGSSKVMLYNTTNLQITIDGLGELTKYW